MTHPNSPRTITPGSRRDLRNHTLLPSTYRTTPLSPTTTRLTVPPLTPFRIPLRRSGTARRGLPSISSPSHLQHPYPRHPFPPLSTDQNPRPYLPLPLPRRLRLHRRPPLSAYMQLPPSPIPTRRREGPQGHPRPQTHRLLNPSANRGRKKLPLLGILHRWRQQLH